MHRERERHTATESETDSDRERRDLFAETVPVMTPSPAASPE
jgi:hypothetical protein